MIERLNHYTISTGDMRTTIPSEVSSVVYFRLSSIIKQAMEQEYVDVLDNTKMKLTVEGNIYVCTLFSGDDLNPILITCGCRDNADLSYLWESISGIYSKIYGKELKVTPISPFIADMILPGAVARLDVLAWTGDFCKCLGWMLLEPKAIVG